MIYAYETSNTLCHYGVLGMKWGVRKDPRRAYDKAKTKSLKLKSKAQKVDSKLAKNSVKINKLSKKMSRVSTDDDRFEKLSNKMAKLTLKNKSLTGRSERYHEKASSWIESMDKTFSKLNLDDLPEEHVKSGEEYITYVLALQAQESARERAENSKKYLDSIR